MKRNCLLDVSSVLLIGEKEILETTSSKGIEMLRKQILFY